MFKAVLLVMLVSSCAKVTVLDHEEAKRQRALEAREQLCEDIDDLEGTARERFIMEAVLGYELADDWKPDSLNELTIKRVLESCA